MMEKVLGLHVRKLLMSGSLILKIGLFWESVESRDAVFSSPFSPYEGEGGPWLVRGAPLFCSGDCGASSAAPPSARTLIRTSGGGIPEIWGIISSTSFGQDAHLNVWKGELSQCVRCNLHSIRRRSHPLHVAAQQKRHMQEAIFETIGGRLLFLGNCHIRCVWHRI